MIEDMVERARLAFLEVVANEPGLHISGSRAERLVRAVISALRIGDHSESCPDDMIDAGRNAFMAWEIEPDDFKRANAATVEAFNAMIDAVLSSPAKEPME